MARRRQRRKHHPCGHFNFGTYHRCALADRVAGVNPRLGEAHARDADGAARAWYTESHLAYDRDPAMREARVAQLRAMPETSRQKGARRSVLDEVSQAVASGER